MAPFLSISTALTRAIALAALSTNGPRAGLRVRDESLTDRYHSNATASLRTMIRPEYYSADTGLWGDSWWTAACSITALAEYSALDPTTSNEMNIGGLLFNTLTKAGASSARFKPRSILRERRLEQGEIPTPARDNERTSNALQRRGHPGFLNEFYDDEGWWALAFIRSYDVTLRTEFLNQAVAIFEDMRGGNKTPCSSNGSGIWWKRNGMDGGYVSAISNELYLTVAASLANHFSGRPERDTYLDIATRQWEWFLASGMINSRGTINDGLQYNTLSDGTISACTNNGGTVWSYNQGVILGGLIELSRATGETRFLNEATRIALAAIQELSNENGILVDSCGDCPGDGGQFKGIFARNLANLHAEAPHPTFREFLPRNADSILERDRDALDGNKMGPLWQGPYKADQWGITPHTSALDGVIAAWRSV